MKRGDVWTISGGAEFAGKPRPAVIIQSDRFDSTVSVTVCLFTTTLRDADILRPAVEPTATNGLARPSQVMIDKLTTVQRSKLGRRIGELTAHDLAAIDTSLLLFLGLVPTRQTE